MIASRRKAERLREPMRERGIDETRLARLQAPAGPDAGAKAPGEVALVAVVGVLALLRGREAAGDAVVVGDEAGAGQGALVDPVCSMVVAVDAATPVETYEDVTYYFCCGGCRTTFRSDPADAAIHRASMASAAP